MKFTNISLSQNHWRMANRQNISDKKDYPKDGLFLNLAP
jgi:hypothetical protein